MATEETPPQCPQEAGAAHLAATEGGTPARIGQHVVNDDTRLASEGRGGSPGEGGGAQGEEGQ